jgi:phage gpG-like protein
VGAVSNRAEVLKALDALARRGTKTARKSGRAVADDAQLVARALLTQREHPAGTKTPSPKGAPPAMIGGDLARSVRAVGPAGGNAEGYAVSKVGPTGLRYGRIHELGGLAGQGHRSRIPPRPFLRPAWRLVKPTVGRVVRETWDSTS